MTSSKTPMIASGCLPVRNPVRLSVLALALAAVASLAAAPPELATQGNQVVVKSTGEPVRLTGVNIASLEWRIDGQNLLTSLQVAVQEWKSNVIRLPVDRTSWLGGNAASYKAVVDQFIQAASDMDVYVILDLHEFGKTRFDDVTFWNDAADRYKNNPAVLFGLFNEPHGTTWEVWRNGDSESPGIQALLETVRATGANNIVLAGGLEYAFKLFDILDGGHELVEQPGGNGIIYDSHVYPWKSYIQHQVGTVGQTHPILIGEIGHRGGTYDSVQNRVVKDHTYWVPNWLDWIDSHNFNWTGWCYHDDSSPRMLLDWNYNPTEYWGAYAKDRLKRYADPDALRVVGGTVIGTTGTRSDPNSGELTSYQRGAVAAFGGSSETYFDAPTANGGWTGLDLITPRRITRIKYLPRDDYGHLMVGGVFEGSNTADFSSGVVTLHEVDAEPADANVAEENKVPTIATVSDTGSYRYVRYRGPDGSYCNVALIVFYTGTNADPAPAGDVIVVDNGSAATTITGSWGNASGSGYHGSRWVNDGNTDKGNRSIRYTPTIIQSGDYEVFVTWAQHQSRATNVPYTISHAGPTSPDLEERDQTEPGLPWQSLGVYYFEAGTSGYVEVSNAGTTNYVSADAAMFVRRSTGGSGAEVNIVIDKEDVDTDEVYTEGPWTFSTYSPSGYTFVGDGAYHDGGSGKGEKSVLFTPDITEAGDYEVSVRWMAHSSRSTSVPIVVTHANGSDIHYVNQQDPSGDWYPLDTYTFTPGTGDVLIHNGGTTGHVSVDAVRFHKAGSAPVVEDVVLDTDNAAHAAYITRSSGWTASTSVAGQFNGTNYYHDGDTRDGTRSVTFTPNLTAGGTYKVYLMWTSATSRASNVPVTIVHANGTDTSQTVNQKSYGGQWRQVGGTYEFNAGTGGSVTITNTGTNGYVIIDAIKFEPQ